MSAFLKTIQELVTAGDLRISEHGYDELSTDRIAVLDVVLGIQNAILVEEYPTAGRGPAILVLEYDNVSNPIHVVWGIPKGRETPAVLITGYRPDPKQWDSSFTRRQK